MPLLLRRNVLALLLAVVHVLLLPQLRADFVEFNRDVACSYADSTLFPVDATDVLGDANWLQSYRSATDASTGATNGGFPVIKCTEVTSEDCGGSTATVVVAISKCLPDATIARIKDWVVAIRAGRSKLTLRKNSVNSELKFVFVLHASTCANVLETLNIAKADTRLSALRPYGALVNALSETGKPTAVISFFKSDDAYTKLQDYEKLWKVPFVYNFQVYDAAKPVAAKANAIFLAKIDDLSASAHSPFVTGLATRFSCTAGLPNGGQPFRFYDAKGATQCICTCPKGYEIVQVAVGKLSCQQLNNPPPIDTSYDECVWDSYGPLRFEVTDDLSVCNLSAVLASNGLPVPRLMTGSVDDGKTATDPSRQLTLAASPQSSLIYDGDEVATALFKIIGLTGKFDRDALLKKRPLRLPTGAACQPKSSSAVSIVAGSKKSCAWTSYQRDPQSSFAQLAIAAFGKYKLTATATDSCRTESCSGCLAIVDKNRPRATTKCPTAIGDAATTTTTVSTLQGLGDVTAVLNAANLAKANASVQQVFAFQEKAANDACSSSNGVSNRCDEQLYELRPFFMDKFTAGKTYAEGRECFSPSRVWADFLSSPTAALVLFATDSVLQADAPVSPGKCTRCCHLDVKLKEKWTDFLCDSNYDTERCDGLESETCSYTQCLTFAGDSAMTADAQIRASVKTESENVLQQLTSVGQQLFQSKTQIHRALSCSRFGETSDASCTFKAKVSELIEAKAAFHSDWFSYGTSGKDPSKFVFWRYKVAGESKWRLLSANADHVFTQSETLITLEAWSQCGLVTASSLTVHLHVHSRVQVCERFDTMWFQTFTAPALQDPGALCSFPKSDFVELTFNFQPSLGLQSAADMAALPMTVSRIVCSASIGGRPGAEILRVEGKSSSFEIVRQFAVQLQQTPTTAAVTDLRVDCSFTYTKYDLMTTTLPCSKNFTLKDCDEPCIGATQSDDTCDVSSCASKGLPVLYEICNTSVVTATTAQTLFKARASTCCQACRVAAMCKPLLSLPSNSNGFGLSRCEPVVSTTPSSRGLVAHMTAYAAQLFASARKSASVLVVAPGVLALAISGGALVLLVAGFATARKVQQQREKLLHEADVYLLMEQ